MYFSYKGTHQISFYLHEKSLMTAIVYAYSFACATKTLYDLGSNIYKNIKRKSSTQTSPDKIGEGSEHENLLMDFDEPIDTTGPILTPTCTYGQHGWVCWEDEEHGR